MITELLSVIPYLVESCTGVVLIENVENRSTQSTDSESSLLVERLSISPLEDFIKFDPQDAIFAEFDPPEHLEKDPKGWRLNLPSLKQSFWECFKTVLLIQGLTATLIELAALFVIFLDFTTAEWCYDTLWAEIPKNVQHLRIIAECTEGFFCQMWSFFCLLVILPLPLIKDLNILTNSLVAAFIDVTYRLSFQMYGIYKISWMSAPLNALFGLVVLINHYRVARHFHPDSLKDTLKLHVVLTSQFTLGVPVWFFLVYKVMPSYVQQDEHIKIFIAAVCPLLTVIPKAVSRLCAKSLILKDIIHPGNAHFLVAITYGISAIVFRAMQAELTSLGLFVALGIGHALIDLLERITITMRDHIWKYLYRLIRRQSRQPKYQSPRSRRFIADLSIQIMLVEMTALVTGLGFINIYQFIYSDSKPFTDVKVVSSFCFRVGMGLLIEVVFNVISVLIQTRVMNIAVNRIWRKKWKHHITVNSLIVCISIFYFSDRLFDVVKNKYNFEKNSNYHDILNCSFPTFY